jgi:hypothetical protein
MGSPYEPGEISENEYDCDACFARNAFHQCCRVIADMPHEQRYRQQTREGQRAREGKSNG